MPKNQTFQRSFQTGLGIGAANFQRIERERIDVEKQRAKDIEKRRIENQKLSALHTALGIDSNDPDEFDPLTKKPKRKAGQEPVAGGVGVVAPTDESNAFVPEDRVDEPVEQQGFQRPDALTEALLKEQMSPEGRSVYNDFIKREDPAISDTYFGVKEMKYPDKEGGGLYGYNKETGEQELITDLPNYQAKPVTGGSYVIYGTADLQGEQVGIKGRRTRIVEMEGGKYKIQDLGAIPSGSKGTKKEKDGLEFEIAMADYQNAADGLANRKQQYLTKDFSKIGGESSREDYRVGYNSGMNELALRTLNLGSEEAKNEGIRMWNQGQHMVRGGQLTGALSGTDMSREDYFDAMRDEILSNTKPSGQWEYKDAQAIIKFLEFKYDSYLAKADTEADEDLFENFEMTNDGTVIDKGNK